MNKRKRSGNNGRNGNTAPPAYKDGRNSWIKNPKEEPHAGSYPLESIKTSEDYARRIVQPDHAVKRKYALCVSYIGSKYQGLQINPDAKTVEAELERALFLAGGIIELNYGFMQKIQWTRAARTDRGVHALTQCCAMKLLFPEKERTQFIDAVNSFLPEDIRLQHMTKVPKNFNAKNLCTKRRYQYLLPTFVLQEIGKVNEILSTAYAQQGPVKGAGYESGYIDPNTSRSLTKETLNGLRESFVAFRADTEVVAKFRDALKLYEGTKNYHNFTSGKEATEANAKRYIVSFTCEDPFVCTETGVEYVLLSVLGQSFLLNQIRKMVHFAVEICRGAATVDDISVAFSDEKIDIPMAPAVGLYLDELFFEGFNIRQRFQTENDKRVAQKKADEAAVVQENEVVNEVVGEVAAEQEEAPLKKQKVEDEANDGDDGDESMREEIDWYAIPDVKGKINKYRVDELHPHIMREEASSLIFLFYLDYCRAFPHDYKPYKLKQAQIASD